MKQSHSSRRPRVVVVGMGDTGVLVAGRLARHCEVIGVSPRPLMVSGQELGLRLTEPSWWRRHYWIRYGRFRRLEKVRMVHALAVAVDVAQKQVLLRSYDGHEWRESYDALVVASGVENGFWRNTALEDEPEASERFAYHRRRLLDATTVAVVGAGATGVSAAYNLARDSQSREVHLFYPGDEILPGYHPRVREHVHKKLLEVGVCTHPKHRATTDASVPAPESGAIAFEGGQESFYAHAILWATGQVRPNSAFLPPEFLDDSGFVCVNSHLQVVGQSHVFAVGDIAATDPRRSSARNEGHVLVDHNLKRLLSGRAGMKEFRAPPFKWGSILGMQAREMTIYSPGGHAFSVPQWLAQYLFFDLALMRFILGGVRPNEP